LERALKLRLAQSAHFPSEYILNPLNRTRYRAGAFLIGDNTGNDSSR
jgi:hypothetical protein